MSGPGGQFPPGSPFGPGGPYHRHDPQQNTQQQRPPRRRGWLRRNWSWYDRYCNARDLRHQMRPRRRSNDSDGGPEFGGRGGDGAGGGGRGGDGPGGGDGCGCDGCGCDLFHLSAFRVLLLTAPTRTPRQRPTVAARAGVTAIRGYQRWLSRRTPCCPHTPSCSHYGLAVVRRYGLLQGARLAGGRIARCTPTVPHGTADPPP